MRLYDKDHTPYNNSFFLPCFETTQQEAASSFTDSPNHQNSQYILVACNLPPNHARLSTLSPHSSANPSKGRA